MVNEPLHDRRLWRPVMVFVCTAIGVIVGRWWTPAPEWCALAACFAALIACARIRTVVRSVLLCLALVSVSAAWWSVRIERAPSLPLLEAIERLSERPLVAVEGVIAEIPEERSIARGVFAEFARPGVSTHFRLDDVRFASDDIGALHGALWVSVSGTASELRAGDRVRVWGRFSAAGVRTNPGDPPYRLRALQSGAVGFLHVPTVDSIERFPAGGSSIRAARAWLQERATSWLEPARRSDDAAAALLLAVLTGERIEALVETDAVVRRIGVAHLLAISGLHLMLLVMLGGFAARMVREPGRATPLITIALIVLYLLLTPARAPIIRAASVTLVFVAGEAAGTRWRREAILAWAATFTLFWRPMELFSPGFQLSYACVAALLLFQRPVRARLFREPLISSEHMGENRFRNAAKSSVAAAVVAWLVATPILAHHVGLLNPFGFLVVLVVAPVFTFVLALGFLTTAISLVWPWLGGALAPVAVGAAELFLHAVLALDQLSLMSVNVPRVPLVLTVGIFFAAVWWLWSPRAWRLTLAVVFIVAVSVGVWIGSAARTQGLGGDVALRIDMLDVGDGSFYLLRSGDEAMLWDAGAQSLSFGRRDAPASIRALGAWRVREALVTHANLDHFSTLPDIAPVVGIRRVRTTARVLEEAKREPHGAAAVLLDQLASHGVQVGQLSTGDSFVFGEARAEVLWPTATAALDDANNLSLVVRFVVPTNGGERSVLLTGDIETEAVRALLSRVPDLHADVLELPHHGSARLAREGFVEAVGPAVVLQSSGRSRLGDERWSEAREGREWLMTAEVGSSWVEILRDGTVRTGAMLERTQR